MDAAVSTVALGEGQAAQAATASDAEKEAIWQTAFRAAWRGYATPEEASDQADAAVPDAAAWIEMRETAASRERVAHTTLIRDVFGNPFRPVPAVDPACLARQGGAVTQLALMANEDRRLPEGTLDPARLALVADALEDAGCADAELHDHLRSLGPHVRGCWAVDLLLGK
jgi:hypothetical protein